MHRVAIACAAIAMSFVVGLSCIGDSGSGSGGGSADDNIDGSDTLPPPGTPVVEVGLDQRPPNLGCVAPARPADNADVNIRRTFPSLSFSSPVGMVLAPDGRHWIVLEKAGRIRRFVADQNTAAATLVADLSERVESGPPEAGLLGFAFHPDFSQNGYVFVSYTGAGSPLTSHVSRFTSSDGGATLDIDSEQAIITLAQPYANHNGGHIAFGPDGYLYVAFGDGGGGGDPHGNGQDTHSLLGKLLRIDVDGNPPYAIPADNPFAQGGGRPEVWAYGLRNPWRFSFDRATGDLWAADVGQNAWEEINRIERGGNYGWNIREGAHCYSSAACESSGLIDPVAEYGHDEGCSVTGGFVYRGQDIPALRGSYLFGDFCSGRVWALHAVESGWESSIIAETGLSITAFAEDSDGELLLVNNDGTLHRLVPAGDATAAFPDTLSASGCENEAGLVPYGVNVPFWSDGSVKRRWFALPDGAQINVTADGEWTLPVGSVIRKDYYLDRQRIETRLLIRHEDGDWAGYTYAWRNDQSDADRVVGGARVDVNRTGWIFPSEQQCLQCHTRAAGRVIGIETAQMNRLFTYGNNRTARQLATLHAIGLIDVLPDSPPALAPVNSARPLAQRAASYLHANCANCHRSEGPTPSGMDLHYATPEPLRAICDVEPQFSDLGIAGAKLLAPGDPDRSLLLIRMQRRDRHAMPPLASLIPDANGASLLSEWISALQRCP